MSSDKVDDGTERYLHLRDRVTKIEATVEYHTNEFIEIKNSMRDLGEKMDTTHRDLMTAMENNEIKVLDALYSNQRLNNEQMAANKKAFEQFVTKWYTVVFVIGLVISALAWTYANDMWEFNFLNNELGSMIDQHIQHRLDNPLPPKSKEP